MTEMELKRCSRGELIAKLLESEKEKEQMRNELLDLKEKLESRELAIQDTGSIAEASLKLHGLFERAQEAADQYLENVQRVCAKKEEEALAREQESMESTQKILQEAKEKCELQEKETREKCERMTKTAKAESDAYWSDIKRLLGNLVTTNPELRGVVSEIPSSENTKETTAAE